jgi:hypothetical protein
MLWGGVLGRWRKSRKISHAFGFGDEEGDTTSPNRRSSNSSNSSRKRRESTARAGSVRQGKLKELRSWQRTALKPLDGGGIHDTQSFKAKVWAMFDDPSSGMWVSRNLLWLSAKGA